jgi:rare lipoprotein A (peptidoglycan hydrolase)
MGLLIHAVRVLALTILGATSMVHDRGLATRFGDPGDPLDGNHLRCTHQPMQPGQLACAHRTLPCGTVLMIENPRTKRMALCEVLDRGPFGAILPSGDWGIKRHRDEAGDWRGIVDLSPAVAEALDFNGREKVRIYYQRPPRHLRSARNAPR